MAQRPRSSNSDPSRSAARRPDGLGRGERSGPGAGRLPRASAGPARALSVLLLALALIVAHLPGRSAARPDPSPERSQPALAASLDACCAELPTAPGAGEALSDPCCERDPAPREGAGPCCEGDPAPREGAGPCCPGGCQGCPLPCCSLPLALAPLREELMPPLAAAPAQEFSPRRPAPAEPGSIFHPPRG